MKRILLTGGPTNEPIDEVMKITNMSTGKLTLQLAKRALEEGCFVCMIINESVSRSNLFERYGFAGAGNLKVVEIETTEDMYHALEAESQAEQPYDVIIHASAVGDYKPQFSFRMEDMAKEIAVNVRRAAAAGKLVLSSDTANVTAGSSLAGLAGFSGTSAPTRLDAVSATPNSADTDVSTGAVQLAALENLILTTLTDPLCKVNDDSKISSYEPHLTVKLTLTTKLIANLKQWYPSALLIGFKLLENVELDHLVEVAQKLCQKNSMDYILANDLAELRKGYSTRHMVTKEGYTGISFNAPGKQELVDYAAEHWFRA